MRGFAGRMTRGGDGAARPLGVALACLCLPTFAAPLAGQTAHPVRGGATPAIQVLPPAVYSEEALQAGFPGEMLVVVDRSGDRLLLVDPATRSVLARLPTGAAPHELALSPDGTIAYVANYGLRGDPDDAPAEPWVGRSTGRAGPEAVAQEGSVSVFDLRRGTLLRTLRPYRVAAGRVLPAPFRRLHGVAVSPDGRRLWLAAEADSGVVEMDAATGEVLMLWKTGAALSRTLVSSRSGRRLLVANRRSDSVTVIDRLTIVAQRIPTGSRPEGLALAPAGNELWVGNRGDHTISVIDLRRGRVTATLAAGGLDPARLAFRPDGSEVWVANRGSRELTVFDARERSLVARVPLELEPLGLQFSPDGGRLYVGAPQAGRLLVVDARRRHLLDVLEVGGAPRGLAWSRVEGAALSGRR